MNKRSEPVTAVETQIDRFVFLDDRPWPFMVSNQSGKYWLYYWSDSYKNFAPLRSLFDDEIGRFRALALPSEKADFYLNYGKQEQASRPEAGGQET